VKMMLELRIHA